VSDEPNKLADQSPVEGEAAAVEDQVALPSVAAADPEGADPEGAGPSGSPIAVEVHCVETGVEEAEKVPGVSDDNSDDDNSDDDNSDDDNSDDEESEEAAAEVEEDEAEVVAENRGEEDSDEIKMDWYILKVQSNREKSITAALKRKIAVEGLEDYFGDVVVPVEKVTEFKGGKKKVVNRKLYPGYIVVQMCINDDTWFAVRETSGIGDFTGSGGKPTPMLPHEVARIIQTEEEETEESPKLNINFSVGEQVKVKDGNFESFEGEVSEIDEHSGRITVMINIFGRSTPVELEYWQVEQV